MTENYYDVLLGFSDELCDDEGTKLYSVKEVADFIHTKANEKTQRDSELPYRGTKTKIHPTYRLRQDNKRNSR